MDFEAEAAKQSTTTTTPVLPLILSSSSSVSALPSLEPSSTITPPLHSAIVVVPFRWEQEPGKPKHSTTIIPFSNRYGSFRSKRGQISVRAVIRRRRWVEFGVNRQWFGSWRAKKREVSGGSYVYPSYGGDHRQTSDVDAIGGTQKIEL
ncbi:hypothetical protein K1719_025328 [Acacia pycnantha]|nr:hypothetical protein K1719_025328 [Acacia pycnantha]